MADILIAYGNRYGFDPKEAIFEMAPKRLRRSKQQHLDRAAYLPVDLMAIHGKRLRRSKQKHLNRATGLPVAFMVIHGKRLWRSKQPHTNRAVD